MKKITILLLLVLCGQVSFSQVFVTTWKTDINNPTTRSINIPIEGDGYDFEVDWSYNGVTFHAEGRNTQWHLYDAPGVYTIAIRGDFPRIHFNNKGSKDQIIAVNQWGDIQWASMQNAFSGCTNLEILANDAPDLSLVTSMWGMFDGCTSFNQSLNHWDVSQVTDMWKTFHGASLFNQPLGNWDVSRVTDMGLMFSSASSFNQSLADWDVGQVTEMIQMLDGTDLSRDNYDATLIGWNNLPFVQQNVNVGVTGLQYCSPDAASARRNLSHANRWRIIGDDYPDACHPEPFVTTWEIGEDGGNIILPTIGDGYNYEVDWSYDGINFRNEGINVASKYYAFPGAYTIAVRGDFPRIYFNNEGEKDNIIAINQWGDIKWTSMEGSFHGCSNLEILAEDAPDLSLVTSLKDMFHKCTTLNQSLNDWDVSQVTNMYRSFSGASSFNQSLGTWNVKNVTTMWGMLNSSGLSKANYESTLIGWSNLPDLQHKVSLGALGLQYCSEAAVDARRDLVDTYGWRILWDSRPFYCDPSSFITSWQLDKSDLNIIIPTMGKGFDYTIDWGDGSPAETKQTGNAKHSYNQSGVYIVSITGDFPRVYFNNNKDIKDKIIAVHQWGDIKWTSMESAFSGCSNLEVLTNDAPNLSSVTSLKGMFYGCSNLNQSLNHWDVGGIKDMSNMLDQTALSRENYEATLIGWSNLPTLQKKVTLGVTGLEYCSKASASARENLTKTHDWNIEGDNQACTVANNTAAKPALEDKISKNISVYPNPGNNIITINYDNNDLDDFNLEIQDMSGRVILRKFGESSFDVSGLKRGIYLIQIENNLENRVVRFIKN